MKGHLLFLWVAFLAGVYLLGNFLYRIEIIQIPELPLQARAVPGRGLIVTEASDAARAAGIAEGDRILSINGRPTLSSQYYFLRTQRFASAGQTARLTVGKGDDTREVRLQWQRPERRRNQLSLWSAPVDSYRFFFDLLLPLALWLIALTLHLSKAEGPTTPWASLMILSQTLWFPGEPKHLWPMGLREIGYVFNGIFGPLFFLFALVFFTSFPLAMGTEKRFPWVKWTLLGLLLGLGCISALHSLSSIYHFGVYAVTSRYTDWIMRAMQTIWVICFLLICVSRVRPPERLSPYQRSRMTLVWGGILVGFLPPLLLLYFGQSLNPEAGISTFPGWLQMLAFLFFLAFPLSVAIAVMGWKKPLQLTTDH